LEAAYAVEVGSGTLGFRDQMSRGLMKLVGQRKRLLTYLSKHNLQGYRALIEKLGIRK
jgi:ribosomal protein S15